ncbi:SIS domain-containing protein [Candidatus Pelagibacter ubique]|nr:SIS domain-containing protein [Candidatus Pelagibacter ubique]
MKKKTQLELKNQIQENMLAHSSLISLTDDITGCIKMIYSSLKKSGKIMFCGNGGSAADAQHLAAEYLVRMRPGINRYPIPAITLAQDTSALTACGNDYSFDDIFLRPFQALASKNDVLVCITTSGNSKNIIKVLKEAKKRKISTIGFLGNQGGQAKNFCDISLVVNSKITARIQECHIFLGHFILEKVEDMLLRGSFKIKKS